jgi:hypothetical protein
MMVAKWMVMAAQVSAKSKHSGRVCYQAHPHLIRATKDVGTESLTRVKSVMTVDWLQAMAVDLRAVWRRVGIVLLQEERASALPLAVTAFG